MTDSKATESAYPLPRIYAWFSGLVLEDYTLMEDLLAHGLPIDVPHPLRHTTALMEATRLGRTAMVEWLLRHGAAPALLNGFPQGTALHCALRRHQWPIAQLLIEACETPNLLDSYGNTPLHAICLDTLDYTSINHAMDVINLLVGKGCSIDALNHEGITALHYTVINDNPQLTELLLVHGAQPNIATPDMHTTPLMIAALEKNITICTMLLQYGADPLQKNSDNKSPIDMFPSVERLASEQAVGGYLRGNAGTNATLPPSSRMN